VGTRDFSVSGHVYPSLVGRNVIVTGGSRGLGRVIALALIEQGANVMITGARSSDDLATALVEAESIGGGACIGLLADSADAESCERVAPEKG
jgi:NAD(P)-dependent dehydrogenase (short-subunit alcohol dehydrogenase family)